MGRRLVLIGLVAIRRGSVEQLAYGAIISITYAIVQASASPFVHFSDDMFATACSMLLAALFLVLLVFKSHELAQTSDVQVVMSVEQKSDHYMDPVAFNASLLAICSGALLLLAATTVGQISAFARQVRKERRLAVARRLRYVSNGHEVEIGPPRAFEDDAERLEEQKRQMRSASSPLGRWGRPKLAQESIVSARAESLTPYLVQTDDARTPSSDETRTVSRPKPYFHVFLSHVWGTGQDQMRIVKQRLLEMIPDLKVFLDVDDLEEIGDLETYVGHTDFILVYCSKGYFHSKNCVRELMAAAWQAKPIIALVEHGSEKGVGLNNGEIISALMAAQTSYTKWGFNNEALDAETLYSHLFQFPAIEWNRIGHFQDVTMRLIAERFLPDAISDNDVFVDRELRQHNLSKLKKPRAKYHIGYSSHNPGALELLEELAKSRRYALRLQGEHTGERKRRRFYSRFGTRSTEASDDVDAPSPLRRLGARATSFGIHAAAKEASPVRTPKKGGYVLLATDKPEDIKQCDRFLLYLTARTWTRGDEESAALAESVSTAMQQGVEVLLAHEMPGSGGQTERDACEFGSFFSCPDGATPLDLLQRGIYRDIAVALRGGPWREASMTLMAMALGQKSLDKDFEVNVQTRAAVSPYAGKSAYRLVEVSKVLLAEKLFSKLKSKTGPSAPGTSSRASDAASPAAVAAAAAAAVGHRLSAMLQRASVSSATPKASAPSIADEGGMQVAPSVLETYDSVSLEDLRSEPTRPRPRPPPGEPPPRRLVEEDEALPADDEIEYDPVRSSSRGCTISPVGMGEISASDSVSESDAPIESI